MTKQELEVCIQTYGRDIYSFCRQLTGSRQEADELYQDTLLTAVEKLERIDGRRNPKSYLLSVAIRLWRNRRRKFAWRRRIAEVLPAGEKGDVWDREADAFSLEEQILAQEKKTAVRLAVSRLPEHLRLVTLLYYMEELSTAQIAGLLRIPKGTVSSRLYQARKRLRRELEKL